jgi:hypothetical protein
MPISNRGKCSLIALALLTSMFLLSGLAPSQQNNEENAEVSRLLSDARVKAAVLSRDADEMEALIRSEVSWQTHASMLDTMKDDVNDLAKSVEKLNATRDSASPWQKQAIDRMIPLMRDLASNTTAAINHLRDLQSRPVSEEYANYLRQNSETAKQLSDMISSFVDYNQTRAKLEKLEQKLEIGTGKRASR